MKFAALCLLAAALPAWGADQWVRLTTPHFELYTTEGEKKGRAAILYFEEVRSFVLNVTHSTWDNSPRVRIIAFKSEKEYSPNAPNGVAAAFYSPGISQDYIVMGDVEEEHFPIVLHEYMHAVIRHADLRLPTWLNEGFADVFSTMKPSDKTVTVGAIKREYTQVLSKEKWLDLKKLTSISARSADYNDKNRVGIFYAESWALTHMLYLDKDYRGRLSQFLASVAGGEDSEAAFETVYQRNSARVYADLQSYLRPGHLNIAVFDTKLEKTSEEALLSPVSEFESSLALADILAVIGKKTEAKAAYDELSVRYPLTSEMSKSLGYFALRSGDRESAVGHLEDAMKDTQDPVACYTLGSLYANPNDNDKRVAAFLKALKLKPDYAEARLELGFAMLIRGNTEGALASFIQIQEIKPRYAVQLFTGLADAYAQWRDLPNARRNAALATKWANTDDERNVAEHTTAYLDAVEAWLRTTAGSSPTARVPAPTEILNGKRPL